MLEIIMCTWAVQFLFLWELVEPVQMHMAMPVLDCHTYHIAVKFTGVLIRVDILSSKEFENNPNSSIIEMPCLSRWFSWLWRHAMGFLYWALLRMSQDQQGCCQGGAMKPAVKADEGFETCPMHTEKHIFRGSGPLSVASWKHENWVPCKQFWDEDGYALEFTWTPLVMYSKSIMRPALTPISLILGSYALLLDVLIYTNLTAKEMKALNVLGDVQCVLFTLIDWLLLYLW
jgi:hypothetical protein